MNDGFKKINDSTDPVGPSPEERNDRPSVLVMVEGLLRGQCGRAINLDGAPNTPQCTAAWLVDYVFEPKDPNESVQHVRADIKATPYRDRVAYLVRKFLALSESERGYVLAARHDGVYWRGDDPHEFVRIVRETLRYKALSPEDKAAYRAAAVGQLRQQGGKS